MTSLIVGAGGTLNVDSGGQVYGHTINLSQAASASLIGPNVNLVGSGGSLILGATTTYDGSGGINGSITNGGTLTPSANPTTTFGRLSASSYRQLQSGELDIVLGGVTPVTTYDQLATSGLVSLSGALHVTLGNGFNPQSGQTFKVLSFGSESGTFSNIFLPSLDLGLGWNVQQLYSNGTISVLPEPAIGIPALFLAVAALRNRRRRDCATGV